MQSPPVKRSIKKDYLEGFQALKDFYSYSLAEPDFRQIIDDKSKQSINRKALAEVLREQHASLSLSPLQQQHLELLEKENTFTITTGHQLVLFGGPLFTVYKILSTITLCQQLSERYPNFHFVPIFWIHTEDHDYEEINHYYTSFDVRHTYKGVFNGPVGSHRLTEDIDPIVPFHFPNPLTVAYTPGNSMAKAFRMFMHELFSDLGLLILNPDNPVLKSEFKPALLEELQAHMSQHLISHTSSNLNELGYPLQISPREINLFYMDSHIRNRIEQLNGHYHVLESSLSYSPREMWELVDHYPERFSPNVALRPLYQETILPNLAYIGGWGELSYWLQLKGVFNHYHINFPLLLPRMSATVFSAEEVSEWRELGFALEDIHESIHELNRKYMPHKWEDSEYTRLTDSVLESFEALDAYIQNFSETLPRSVRGQRAKTINYFIRLRKKIHKVVRHAYPKPFERIEALKQAIQPNRIMQERILSLAAFKDIQPLDFIKIIEPYCDPLDFSHKYIILPEKSR